MLKSSRRIGSGSDRSDRRQLLHSIFNNPLILPILLLLTLITRAAFSLVLPLESDEAINGLMAKHILSGARPIFYYGQEYMGSLEAYLIAPLFALFGVSTFIYRVLTFFLAAVFVLVTYHHARLLYDREESETRIGQSVALLSALFLALPPLFLLVWSTKARSGYIITLVFGQLALLLWTMLTRRGVSTREITLISIGLGLTAGLAVWTNLLVLPYFIAIGLAYIFYPGLSKLRIALLALPGFFVGSLPFWLRNIETGFQTFRELSQAKTGDPLTLKGLLVGLREFYLQSAPILLGFVQPDSHAERFLGRVASGGPAFWLGAIVAAGLFIIALWRFWMIARQGRRTLGESPELPLFLLLALVPLLFVFDKVASLHYGEPRYALPLYSTLPLFISGILALGRRFPRAVGIALVVALALNIRSGLRFNPELAVPVVDGRPLPLSLAPLIQNLSESGIGYVYADYWMVYSLALESDERVAGSVMRLEDGEPHIGYNRYTRYPELVEAAPAGKKAFVCVAKSECERAIGGWLAGSGTSFDRGEVGGFVVYSNLLPPRSLLP